MSLAFGMAAFMLVLMATYHGNDWPLGDAVLLRLKNLLGVFVAAVLLLVLIYHLTNLYMTERHGVERFILWAGGAYTVAFWAGQILLGSLVPLALFYLPQTATSRLWIAIGAALVIVGGFLQMFVIIIGGQAYPIVIFPDKEIIESSFFDGAVARYVPSLPEVLLGLGGIAIALLIVTLALKVLRFLPVSLADEAVLGREEQRKPV
jgi:molybdopterin-containing oxidoreductase family membrane subunit